MTPLDLRHLDTVTREIHAEARAATNRKSYVEGTAGRRIANRIRSEFGLARLSYNGVPSIHVPRREEVEES